MKIKLALLTACCGLLMAHCALADSFPPDPQVGIGGGGQSQEIFSTNFNFTLTNCVQNPTDPECIFATKVFGSTPQGVFAGDNDSGQPIGALRLTLNFSALQSPETLNCNGGALFSLSDCPQILPTGSTSATFSFFKGTGTGIGCYDFKDPADSGPNARNSANANCLSYTQQVLNGQIPSGFEDICPQLDSDDVCSSAHFLIAVGFGGDNWPVNNIPSGGGGQVLSPEPGTLALFLTGFGALAKRWRRVLKK